jgi:hypothetical protein
MGADTRREVYGADAGDEKWNPEESVHWVSPFDDKWPAVRFS